MPQMPHQQQASIHVLVVEDDAVSRDVALQMLTYFGYRVSAVDSGPAALAAIELAHHDLVLMDCRMIDMDGLETTRRLRAGQAGPSGRTVPIVALTAQGFAADREACLAAGMNDFLTKPVSVERLIPTVEHWTQNPASKAMPGLAHTMAPQPLAPATTAAVFDPGVLAALPMVADGSQPDYGEVVLNIYLQSTAPLLASFRQAISGDDSHTAQRAAHTLKSSSAAVGALALAACAAGAEAHLQAGHKTIAHLPALLEEAFARLCTALDRAPQQDLMATHTGQLPC